jgi:hypothetical protein
MPNIQQPEMRRSGRDPLVQDSAELRAGAAPGSGTDPGPVPPDQRSPYGPQPPAERRADPAGTGQSADQGDPDAILIGGPREGTTVHSQDAALIRLEIEGLVHRYIRTTAQREADGRELIVYNYDGEVRPD